MAYKWSSSWKKASKNIFEQNMTIILISDVSIVNPLLGWYSPYVLLYLKTEKEDKFSQISLKKLTYNLRSHCILSLKTGDFQPKLTIFSDTNIRLFRSPVWTGISLPMSRIENWKRTYLTWMVKVSTKQLASNWHSLLKLNFKRGYFQTSMTIFSANDKHYLDWILLCMVTPRAKN